MSQENVEVVRAALEALNVGDMDSVRSLLDSDAILRPPTGWPEPGPYVGQEEVMREWNQVREVWKADTVEPVTDFVHPTDRVVVRVVWHTAGHGPEPKIELTVVYRIRNGKILLCEYFWDHGEALAAVGLPE